MSEYKPLQIPCYLHKFQSLAKSFKFEFITQENIKPEQLTQIMKFLDKLGWLSFNLEMIQATDLTDLPKIDFLKYPDRKSPSQKLRSILFLLHMRKGGTKENFQIAYDNYMERLIAKHTDELNQLD